MYGFTDDQKMIRGTARQIARERIAPRAAEIDATDEFPWDIIELLADTGLLGVMVPEKYGGPGQGVVTLCLVVEEIAQVSGTVAIILVAEHTPLIALALAGNEEQKAAYLPRIARGPFLLATCLTEPGAGSDVASISTRAVLDGDVYRLTGTKIFVTHGGVADLYLVFAVTNPSARKRADAISCFLIEPDSPGFRVAKIEQKMGMRGSPLAEIVFEDVPARPGQVLGGVGQGFRSAMRALEQVRPVVGAAGVGIAQGALDYAINYAQQRTQFGRPIASFQGLQFLFADLAMQIEAARYLCYEAAYREEKGLEKAQMYSSMAKCLGTDVAMNVTTQAVQVLGGAGYMKDHPVERMMRDAKATQIFEGANHTQRMVIARHLVGRFD